jgi:hypothetical protein
MRRAVLLLTCAWVLWGYGFTPDYDGWLLQKAAFETRTGCVQHLDQRQASAAESVRDTETYLRVLLNRGGFGLLQCLPDTIDPRGAKR